jgi:crossover junction endodeoxyribonuclease RusA
VIVTLPWPDKRLSPNARVHWRTHAPLKKAARLDACLLTFAAMGSRFIAETRERFKGAHPIPVKVTFYPPDKRRRDRDNMQASLKHALDGLADAIAVDDNRFRLSYDFGLPQEPGRVEVTVG